MKIQCYLRVGQVDPRDLTDPLNAILAGTSMQKELVNCLRDILIILQVDIQSFAEITIIMLIIVHQLFQTRRNEQV